MIAPLLVAFVTVPIYVSHIGAARYGVLSIVWLLLGYFGFLDFGLVVGASVNALAKLKHASQAERSKVLVTAASLNLALGVLRRSHSLFRWRLSVRPFAGHAREP